MHARSLHGLTVEAEDVLLAVLDLHGVNGGEVVEPDEAQSQVLTMHQHCNTKTSHWKANLRGISHDSSSHGV